MNNETITLDAERREYKIQTVLDIVAQLSDLLDTENNGLKTHDFGLVKEMMGQKTALAHSYNDVCQLFKQHPEILQEADAERGGLVKKSLMSLQEKMNLNASLLKANMDANNKLIQLIIDSTKTHRAEQNSVYDAAGTLNDASGKSSAISFNKVL